MIFLYTQQNEFLLIFQDAWNEEKNHIFTLYIHLVLNRWQAENIPRCATIYIRKIIQIIFRGTKKKLQ